MSTLFAIIGARRSGTNMLVSMLRQVPDVVCFGEIFNKDIKEPYVNFEYWGVNERYTVFFRLKDMGRRLIENRFVRPDLILEAIASSDQGCIVGLKTTYEDLFQYLDRPARLAASTIASDARFIHVKRRNLLRQYCSLKIAEKSGIWIVYDKREMPSVVEPLVIDVAAFFSYLGVVSAYERAVDVFLAGLRHLPVYYEDLIEEDDHARARVADFLECRSHVGFPQTLRQSNSRLDKMVTNLDDVMRLVENTPYAGRCTLD